jgi:hypothetical protein
VGGNARANIFINVVNIYTVKLKMHHNCRKIAGKTSRHIMKNTKVIYCGEQAKIYLKDHDQYVDVRY